MRKSDTDFQEKLAIWSSMQWSIPQKDRSVEALNLFINSIDKAIAVAHTPNYSFYDKLHDIETQNSIPGIPASNNIEVTDYDSNVHKLLCNLSWTEIVTILLQNMDSYSDCLSSDVLSVLKKSKALLDKRDDVLSNHSIVIDNHINIDAIGVLEDYNVTKQHWIVDCFIHYWKGVSYDILFDPLLSFVSIEEDVAKYIKHISDVFIGIDGFKSYGNNSYLVKIKNTHDVFVDYGCMCLDVIDTYANTNRDVFFIMDQELIKLGVLHTDRFLLIQSMFWMCERGCLKGVLPDRKDVRDVLLSYFKFIQPSGCKLLLDYPS